MLTKSNWAQIIKVHPKLLRAALIYNAVVFAAFTIVYMLMDFDKHFDSSGLRVTWRGKLYYAALAHTAGGANDIVCKSDTARTVTALHATLAWIQMVIVLIT